MNAARFGVRAAERGSPRCSDKKGRDGTVTRKVLASATALLLATELVVASAWAGPGTGGARAQGDGPLRVASRNSVPAAARAVRSMGVKAAPSVRNLEPVPAREGKLETRLVAKLESGAAAGETFDVVVTTTVDPAQLKLDGLQVKHQYHEALYGFAAKVTREEILALKQMTEVESIGIDEVVKATVDNAGLWTGTTKVRDDYGLTGDGDGFEQRHTTRDVVIAIIDTGIDVNHKDLKGKVLGWKDVVNDKPQPYDDNGHGTHVAGTATGAGAVSRNMRGVAPGAALVGVKVLDAEGSGSYSGVIAGVDWVVANRAKYNIRVLNMSLGSAESSDGLDALSRAVNGAVEAGIVVVVAAGNAGPDDYTVGSPGAAARALTICALRDVGENGWSLAPFSSRGPTADGRIKPDLCAPGVRISAAQAGTPDRFVAYSGTSMASPFAAGVVALMLEANPYLTPDEVRDLLIGTAQDWGKPGPDNDYGHGRINGYRAVQRILGLPGIGPTNPTHAVGRGTLQEGAEVWYKLQVTDIRTPLAATLLMTNTAEEFYDFDLFLFDADGIELASSMDLGRQETINLKPPKVGTFYLKIEAYEGSGPFTVDVSWR